MKRYWLIICMLFFPTALSAIYAQDDGPTRYFDDFEQLTLCRQSSERVALGTTTVTKEVRMRSASNTQSEVIRRLDVGERLSVYDFEIGELVEGRRLWYNVETEQGERGYVWTGAIEYGITPPPLVAPPPSNDDLLVSVEQLLTDFPSTIETPNGTFTVNPENLSALRTPTGDPLEFGLACSTPNVDADLIQVARYFISNYPLPIHPWAISGILVGITDEYLLIAVPDARLSNYSLIRFHWGERSLVSSPSQRWLNVSLIDTSGNGLLPNIQPGGTQSRTLYPLDGVIGVDSQTLTVSLTSGEGFAGIGTPIMVWFDPSVEARSFANLQARQLSTGGESELPANIRRRIISNSEQFEMLAIAEFLSSLQALDGHYTIPVSMVTLPTQ
ncbi:MAG: SH3 domain-containing protein [Phototrophicaceae bacterium]